MSSLRNAEFNGRFGYGTAGYLFDDTGLTTIWREKELWMERFIYETSVAFALSPKLSSEFGLLHDNSQWVGPTSFQPHRKLRTANMLVRAKVKYRYRDIHVKFDLLSGNGQQATLGLGILYERLVDKMVDHSAFLLACSSPRNDRLNYENSRRTQVLNERTLNSMSWEGRLSLLLSLLARLQLSLDPNLAFGLNR